jgi:hypothetical protein
MLLSRAYDEGLFMGIAALDILGAMLAFGAVVVPLLIFTGALGAKIFDTFLLLGILLLTLRYALRSFRPQFASGTFRLSRILAGCYCLFLAAGAVYYIIAIFTS